MKVGDRVRHIVYSSLAELIVQRVELDGTVDAMGKDGMQVVDNARMFVRDVTTAWRHVRHEGERHGLRIVVERIALPEWCEQPWWLWTCDVPAPAGSDPMRGTAPEFEQAVADAEAVADEAWERAQAWRGRR